MFNGPLGLYDTLLLVNQFGTVLSSFEYESHWHIYMKSLIDIKFEFRRKFSADVTYKYQHCGNDPTEPIWKRDDKELWMMKVDKIGWAIPRLMS